MLRHTTMMTITTKIDIMTDLNTEEEDLVGEATAMMTTMITDTIEITTLATTTKEDTDPTDVVDTTVTTGATIVTMTTELRLKNIQNRFSHVITRFII